MSSEPSTSSDPSLLYSEYVNSDPVEHIVKAADKKKEKPVIKFTKSLVLARVIGLLSALKESEKEFKKKSEKERNIEICEEGAPVVEMNVAVLKESADSKSTDVECADTSSDSDDSDDDENTSLPEYLSGIFKKDASDRKIFKLATTEPTVSELSGSPSKEKNVAALKESADSKSTDVQCADTSSDSDDDENTSLPEYLSGIFKKDASDCKIFKLATTEPTVSELSGSPSKKKVRKLSQDLESEDIVVETAIINSDLEPPAKKICVM